MNNYFYNKLNNKNYSQDFLASIEQFANNNKIQIYVLSNPLTDNKYLYSYQYAYIILTPKKKITFVQSSNDSKDKDAFEDYMDDVKLDIASISDKFDFREHLGRPRQWNNLFKVAKEREYHCFENLYNEMKVNEQDFKKIEILISLFIGSINDASSISLQPEINLLDKIKNKVLLFDTDQTRFIYDNVSLQKKSIRIQGLSGTGKTELLLHKLKDLYLNDEESRICFTCHNHVLADTLRKRVTSFFNSMKVSQQIDWENRLLCVNAWGTRNNASSGTLRRICEFYNVSFYSLREVGSFNVACKKVKDAIKKNKDFDYAFTYMFIDESQDFGEYFFNLCELVTEKKVYIAGDIFQSIFESPSQRSINSDYLLSKCYRTEPKTLMFAQALGMGLFEDNKLWWLSKEQWELCGYNVKIKNGNEYELTRDPIRRFEDIKDDYVSLKMVREDDYKSAILEAIIQLKKEYPNITCEDIAIIYVDSENYIFNEAVMLGDILKEKFGWDYNLAYENKKVVPNTIFISNRNNVKGLEFPFVFCFTTQIIRDHSYRNTLYTMLTRSLLRSYLIVQEIPSSEWGNKILQGMKNIREKHCIQVIEPTQKEKDLIMSEFRMARRPKSLHERANDIFKELHIEFKYQQTILDTLMNNEDVRSNQITDENLKEKLEVLYKVLFS